MKAAVGGGLDPAAPGCMNRSSCRPGFRSAAPGSFAETPSERARRTLHLTALGRKAAGSGLGHTLRVRCPGFPPLTATWIARAFGSGPADRAGRMAPWSTPIQPLPHSACPCMSPPVGAARCPTGRGDVAPGRRTNPAEMAFAPRRSRHDIHEPHAEGRATRRLSPAPPTAKALHMLNRSVAPTTQTHRPAGRYPAHQSRDPPPCHRG